MFCYCELHSCSDHMILPFSNTCMYENIYVFLSALMQDNFSKITNTKLKFHLYICKFINKLKTL